MSVTVSGCNYHQDTLTQFHTATGTLSVRLSLTDPDQSLHVENFLRHCASGSYDGTTIVRYIPLFILQLGDPTNTGKQSEPADPSHEFTGVKNSEFKPRNIEICRGTLLMINNKEHTVGSQFFFVLSDRHADSFADRLQYTPIGVVSDSFAALDQLEASGDLAADNLKKNGKIRGRWKETSWIERVEILENPYA